MHSNLHLQLIGSSVILYSKSHRHTPLSMYFPHTCSIMELAYVDWTLLQASDQALHPNSLFLSPAALVSLSPISSLLLSLFPPPHPPSSSQIKGTRRHTQLP